MFISVKPTASQTFRISESYRIHFQLLNRGDPYPPRTGGKTLAHSRDRPAQAQSAQRRRANDGSAVAVQPAADAEQPSAAPTDDALAVTFTKISCNAIEFDMTLFFSSALTTSPTPTTCQSTDFHGSVVILATNTPCFRVLRNKGVSGECDQIPKFPPGWWLIFPMAHF